LKLSDSRVTSDGVIIIKSQSYRTQDMNKQEALERLKELILSAMVVQKKRKPTKPTRSSQRKRMDSKTKKGSTKVLRGKVSF